MFVVLYLAAAYLYPGGNQADSKARGFSWLHNYWCNLLNEQAMNGQPNPGQPVALAAMGVLGVSVALFWYNLPRLFNAHPRKSNTIRALGLLSTLFASLIFTPYHDLLINLASVFGGIALLLTLLELLREQFNRLFLWGIGCIVLIGANTFIYHSSMGLIALPLLQKITFVCVLSWLSALVLANH